MPLKELEAQFLGLPENIRVQIQIVAEERQRRYRRIILPDIPLQKDQLLISDPELARVVVGLESFYDLAALVIARINYSPFGEIGQDIQMAAERYFPITEGDWRPLKSKWLNLRPLGEQNLDYLTRISATLFRQKVENRSLIHARRVVSLIPDQTEPFDPTIVDCDSPFFKFE